MQDFLAGPSAASPRKAVMEMLSLQAKYQLKLSNSSYQRQHVGLRAEQIRPGPAQRN